MLSTQIQYLNFLEQRRHNEAMEIEQYRSNRAQEYRTLRNIKATERKNAFDIKQRAQEIANARWNMERQNEVNRMNAQTNRFNAINQQRKNYNDWNVALQANSIAQENANWNRLNALSREFANEVSLGQLGLAERRANADIAVNWQNAQTNARNAQIRQQELNVQRQHYQWADTAALINSTANVANAIFKGVQTYPSLAQTAFVMGRM